MTGDVEQAQLQLMPRGKAWSKRLGSAMRSLITGISVEWALIQERLDQALLEIQGPNTVTETIADWEYMLGLPSECTPIAATLSERREEAQRRWVRHGQWAEHVGESFLIDRVVELGYLEADVELRRFHFESYTCESECDDYLNSEDVGWFFVYEFIVISGDDDARVICEIEKRYLQAHLGSTFAFPLTRWDRGTFTRTGAAVATNPDTLIETALAADTMGQFYYGV